MKQTRKQAKAKPEQPLSLEDLDRIVGGTAKAGLGVTADMEESPKARSQEAGSKRSSG